mmetsp:Transcript_30550/g.63792  ORF Transcript_30550/g.63792 Transcript_30550/m.63792 type:complete len:281 (+) Transcript_30550:1000-1842(+)
MMILLFIGITSSRRRSVLSRSTTMIFISPLFFVSPSLWFTLHSSRTCLGSLLHSYRFMKGLGQVAIFLWIVTASIATPSRRILLLITSLFFGTHTRITTATTSFTGWIRRLGRIISRVIRLWPPGRAVLGFIRIGRTYHGKGGWHSFHSITSHCRWIPWGWRGCQGISIVRMMIMTLIILLLMLIRCRAMIGITEGSRTTGCPKGSSMDWTLIQTSVLLMTTPSSWFDGIANTVTHLLHGEMYCCVMLDCPFCLWTTTPSLIQHHTASDNSCRCCFFLIC